MPTIARLATIPTALALLLLPSPSVLRAREATSPGFDGDPWTAATFRGLAPREIGPASTSGGISDFAVNEAEPGEYYVAVSSGGVWKTVNWGTPFEPIFDGEAS